jgi:hypothetical protein
MNRQDWARVATGFFTAVKENPVLFAVVGAFFAGFIIGVLM